MADHTMVLNDLIHRTLLLDTELTTDDKLSVKVVYKKDPDGNLINFLVIKSLAQHKIFGDLDIPVDGIKIPPDVPEFKKNESKDNYQDNLQS